MQILASSDGKTHVVILSKEEGKTLVAIAEKIGKSASISPRSNIKKMAKALELGLEVY